LPFEAASVQVPPPEVQQRRGKVPDSDSPMRIPFPPLFVETVRPTDSNITMDTQAPVFTSAAPSLSNMTNALEDPHQFAESLSHANIFVESVAFLSIQGNPVSVAIGNPNLPDCPLLGISEGFTALTGFPCEDILGRNCRLLNDGCSVPIDVRSKIRCSIATGGETLVVMENNRKDGSKFRNLLYLSGFQVGDRSYMVGIQTDDITSPGQSIAHTPDHRKELQSVMDRIFDLYVENWAETELHNFGSRLAYGVSNGKSYCTALKTFNPEWYATIKSKFVYRQENSQGTTPGLNIFLETERHVPWSPPPDRGVVGGGGSTQYFAGASSVQAMQNYHGPTPVGRTNGFCYTPSAMLVAIGQRLHLVPDNISDLLGAGMFSAVPPFRNGLRLDPHSGAITGQVVKDTPGPAKWSEHQVFAIVGRSRFSTMIQIKVVDLKKDVIVEHFSELPGGQYIGTFREAPREAKHLTSLLSGCF
jgi:hypothetical protein